MEKAHIWLISGLFLTTLWLTLTYGCTTVEKVRTGDQAMERKQYAVAAGLLQKEIETVRGSIRYRKAFQLGEAYRMMNQPAKALEWYLASEQYGMEQDRLYWLTGLMYKQTGEYDQAISYFDRIDYLSPLGADARREKDICRQAKAWALDMDRRIELNWLPIAPDDASVYATGFYSNGNLVVTSDQRQNAGKPFKWTGRDFTDIFLVDPVLPQKLSQLPGWKYQDFNQGNASFNENFTQMIYTVCDRTRQDENFCSLRKARLNADRWVDDPPFDFIKPGINYSQAYLTRDSILFFCSNDPAGYGGYDLYYTVRSGEKWQSPVRLPFPINSPGNEKFPTVDGDTLYFSSDYLPGLGGLDLFRTHIQSNGEWSPPQRLPVPVNSSYDDFAYLPVSNPKSPVLAYFSSTRNSGKGADQIARVSRIDAPVTEDSLVVQNEPVRNYQLFLSLKVTEKVFQDPSNPNSRVIGKKPVEGVSGLLLESGKTFSTRNDGRYITQIPFDSLITVRVGKDGYLQQTVQVPPSSIPTEADANPMQTVSLEIVLAKPFFEQEIVLENIYYDLDRWFIREDAKPTLDQLARLLADNQEVTVLIASHTDCRADEAYNLELSGKRARSVVEYLKGKGIAENRMSFTGYGESRLIENCPCESCTEAQHQRNRRTTFTLSTPTKGR